MAEIDLLHLLLFKNTYEKKFETGISIVTVVDKQQAVLAFLTRNFGLSVTANIPFGLDNLIITFAHFILLLAS